MTYWELKGSWWKQAGRAHQKLLQKEWYKDQSDCWHSGLSQCGQELHYQLFDKKKRRLSVFLARTYKEPVIHWPWLKGTANRLTWGVPNKWGWNSTAIKKCYQGRWGQGSWQSHWNTTAKHPKGNPCKSIQHSFLQWLQIVPYINGIEMEQS